MSAPSGSRPPAPATPAIKICGVTKIEDAERCVALGVELVGLNFYRQSPRCLELDRAAEIRRAIGERALVVGVFVNSPGEYVRQVQQQVGLDLVQFHGDERAEEILPFAARAIRALRPDQASESILAGYAGTWGLLFDTPRAQWQSPDQYGGSGRSWRYDAVARRIEAMPGRRILIAGGIGPDTVGDVLAQVPGVWGVDVSSGVEAAPGQKDPELLERLVVAVRSRQRTGELETREV